MPATTYKILGKKVHRYEIEILKEAEELHMAITGSGGDPPPEVPATLAARLEARLKDWTPSIDRYAQYDHAVRGLMLAVLNEYHCVERIPLKRKR